jgi:dipeptidyl aminopeptidase/acylaminoacyl peptidase
MPTVRITTRLSLLFIPVAAVCAAGPDLLTSKDQLRLQDVAEAQISPDGLHIAYSIRRHDDPTRSYTQMWMADVSSGQSRRLGSDRDRGSGPRWSPDGQWLAYVGSAGPDSGLVVMKADGMGARVIAPVEGTNHPLPSSGERIAWSPDGKQIAFVSAQPGPEAGEAQGDPMIIRRYLYKPTASTGTTRFDDNRRLHIFIAEIASGKVRQLTKGDWYEHSIDWSPRGEILFVSNHEADPDRHFNYDIFAVKADDGRIRQITKTKAAEYRPRWSPDGSAIAFQGTKRDLTSSETTMEDTHIWLMDADGGDRREIGAQVDNRQGPPEWSRDGKVVWFTVENRGTSGLYRFDTHKAGAKAEAAIVNATSSVGAWSVSDNGTVALTMSTPRDTQQLYVMNPAGAPRQLTNLNADLLRGKSIAEVEAFDFDAEGDLRVQAFLTKPAVLTPGRKYPMVLMIHGGPHGQLGPAFNLKAQVYAAHGFASLMVNYRGSTGYGQKFADAIFKDQDGAEARDVLAGTDAALKRYPWIDSARLGIEGGSYGGQLTNWLITQTDRFKAAIPSAGISNLLSFNYMAYYHDYLAVEFGAYPHENDLLDVLWQRSPLKHVARVKTPTMFIHGENDNDVPIAEAEQFFIALKDVGVDTIMLRYPREGHGLREDGHIVDAMNRSLEWYDNYFGSK